MDQTSQTSEKKVEANRQNAQKSTGPKTPEGKANSRMNALKHGLTAQSLILATEDAEHYDNRLGQWLDDFEPANAAERALIDLAVQSSWKLERANRHERARASERVRHAADEFEAAEQIRAEEIGRRLLHDPLNRCGSAPKDERTLDLLEDWFKNDDPPVLHQKLFKSAKGVDWMLRQWVELSDTVDRSGYWHYNDKFRALRLMGKRPQDAMDEFEIAMIFVACHAAHPGPWPLWDELHQGRLGMDGKPLYMLRTQYLEGFKYEKKENAVLDLKSIVKREMMKLNARKAELDPIHAADKAEAGERALLDGSKETALLHRYQSACERTLLRSIAELAKLQKQRAKEEREEELALKKELEMAKKTSAARTATAAPQQQQQQQQQPAADEEPAVSHAFADLSEQERNEAKYQIRVTPQRAPKPPGPDPGPPQPDAG
jgi:hypothetical protein